MLSDTSRHSQIFPDAHKEPARPSKPHKQTREQSSGVVLEAFWGCSGAVLGSFWVCSGVVLGLVWVRFRVLDAPCASRDAVKATLGSFSCWIQWKPSQCPETRDQSAKYRSSQARNLNYGSSRARNRPTRSGRKRARNGARSEIARNENTAPSFKLKRLRR